MDKLIIRKDMGGDEEIIFFEKVESGWYIWYENYSSMYECIEEFHQLKHNGIKQVSYLINNFDMDLKKIDGDRYQLTIDYIMGNCEIIIILRNKMTRLENENQELKARVEILERENDVLKSSLADHSENNCVYERRCQNLKKRIEDDFSEVLKKYRRQPGLYSFCLIIGGGSNWAGTAPVEPSISEGSLKFSYEEKDRNFLRPSKDDLNSICTLGQATYDIQSIVYKIVRPYLIGTESTLNSVRVESKHERNSYNVTITYTFNYNQWIFDEFIDEVKYLRGIRDIGESMPIARKEFNYVELVHKHTKLGQPIYVKETKSLLYCRNKKR